MKRDVACWVSWPRRSTPSARTSEVSADFGGLSFRARVFYATATIEISLSGPFPREFWPITLYS